MALLLSACGGGGGGGSPPAPPPPPPPPPGTVQISGKVTYDYVPHASSGGLAYAQAQARPARLVTVQFVAGAATPVTTRTNLTGDYTLNVPANTIGLIRAHAQSSQTGAPGWTFSVVDNTSSDAIYTLDGASLSSGATSSVRNLHAASGWTGTSYGNPRSAAPFAILDTVYTAAAYVVAADPTIIFPALEVHWSPDNIGSFGADGDPDPETGELGTSFYSVSPSLGLDGIYLLGEENQDSDEYDAHVVIHEFGHYLEHRFGRSENFGGPHRANDLLDPRVAFSEGWPTAVAGLALADPLYLDAGGAQQLGAVGFNIERQPVTSPHTAPGWYSERSIWELVYDLVDTAADSGGAGAGETLAYPFTDIWTVLKGRMTTSAALPTIFPFWDAIKDAHPGDAVRLNQLTTGHSISQVADDFATGETNNAGSPHVLPLYTQVTPNGAIVNLCSVDDFTNPVTGSAVNKLSSRRFLRFTSPLANSTVTITVSATSIPAGEYADPDFLVHWNSLIFNSDVTTKPPSLACKDNATGSNNPSTCEEVATIPVSAAEYVLEIYEWTNTNDWDDPVSPPIGDTCFNVRVQQP